MNPSREELLFQLALTKSAEDRGPFLDRECAGDAALRQRVEALLSANEQPDTALDLDPKSAVATMEIKFPKGPGGTAIVPVTEKAGDTIGRYKLLQQIGEGGCGVVYMAEQTEPVKRRVALKVIKLGMDTKQVVARFEAERQALALMDHPNIAKVLDAGATSTGRPYFVMELVRGTKITEFCDQQKLSTHERLDLFIQVCSAIQHAHQKGIIHRDIKPSNVLVTMVDGKAVPKVIDFGIAKATTGQELTDKTLFTAFEQFIGTPAYMSPEQAEMSGVDIDTRSDIYSLGVLLYELLTGRTPFDAQELIRSGVDGIRKTLRDQEPAKPSAKLQTLAEVDLTTVAKARHVEPSQLKHTVSGDLDWVVMKCLEKDRARRYDTANGLAADLRRHLGNEPVVARPPSLGYLFQKAFRRNKLAFAAAGAISLALLIGIVASTWQAFRATRAEKAAQAETQRAVEAEKNALTETKRAEAEAKRAAEAERSARAEAQRATEAEKLAGKRLAESEQARKEAETIAKFMQDVFISPIPGREGRNVTVVQALDRAVNKLNTKLADQPATRIRLLETIAATYFELALPDRGVPIRKDILDYYRATLGPDDPKTLESAHILMVFYFPAKHSEEAIKLAKEYLPRMNEKLGPEHKITVYTSSLLAGAYFNVGRKEEALALREETLPRMVEAYGSYSKPTLNTKMWLAESLYEVGQTDEAIKLLEEILQVRRETFGSNSPPTLWATHTLAVAYYGAGRKEEAIKLEEEAVPLMDEVLDPQHGWTITARKTLKTWRGELAPAAASQQNATLTHAFTEALNHTEESTDADSVEFWGDRAKDGRVIRLARSGLELNKQPDGTWEANLSKVKNFSDLALFKGTSLSRLILTGTAVVDLAPLRGMALRELNLNETKVSDLEPLRGMPLEALRLTHTGVSDLSPLRGMPLTKLFVNGTMIENLEPLRGMRLTELSLAGTKVSDLSVLSGMPLISLKLGKCEEITNLSPIRDCANLTTLTLPPNAKDIGFLRSFPALARISYTENAKVGWIPDKTAAEFWQEYDAKKKTQIKQP